MERNLIPISDLDLSIRCTNLLRSCGIEYLEELCLIKRSEMTKFRNLGLKSLKEVDEAMSEKGLTFAKE